MYTVHESYMYVYSICTICHKYTKSVCVHVCMCDVKFTNLAISHIESLGAV